MNKITDIELESMLKRCEAASPGPWISFVEGRDHASGSDFIKTKDGDIELSGATTADQDFIAQARQDVPRLINEIKELRKRLKDHK